MLRLERWLTRVILIFVLLFVAWLGIGILVGPQASEGGGLLGVIAVAIPSLRGYYVLSEILGFGRIG